MTDARARQTPDTEAGHTEARLRVSVSADDEGDSESETPGDAETLTSAGEPPAHALGEKSRRRLVNLLLAKGAAELLFVAVLAVGFYHTTFNSSFQGSLEHADAQSVRGWVVDKSEPERAVEVQLHLNDRFVASGVADRLRPDASAKGYAPDERHGFVFDLDPPSPGDYEARVYAVHASGEGRRRTLQQIGETLRFRAD